MHGNRIVGRNESIRYRVIAGWIDKVVIFSLSLISLVQSANCELFSITLTLLSNFFFCSGFAPGRFRYSSTHSLERARFFFSFFSFFF